MNHIWRVTRTKHDMEVSDQAVREIVRVIRKHVDQATLERMVEELIDVPGNKNFRDLVQVIADEVRLGGED